MESYKNRIKKDYQIQVLSRHGSHSILRSKLPKLPFRCCVRLGSETVLKDAMSLGGRTVEVNEIEGVRNSANKLLMKKCFNRAEIKTAEWFTIKSSTEFKVKDTDEICLLDKLPYPLIVKNIFGSRGTGNYYIKSVQDLQSFLNSSTRIMSNYIVEKYYTYVREYRLHVTSDGCFYTCRKMLKRDANEANKFQKHSDNCVWMVSSNELFDQPINWNTIIEDCVKALNNLNLDIAAFDVRVQSAKDSKGNIRENPDWIIVESGSAPSFGNITGIKYLEIIPQIANKKAKFHNII